MTPSPWGQGYRSPPSPSSRSWLVSWRSTRFPSTGCSRRAAKAKAGVARPRRSDSCRTGSARRCSGCSAIDGPSRSKPAKPVPDWADQDGIIPLTPLAKETTLFERVQERLRADEIDAKDFAEVMGKPLDAWLATEFFKHHTKQFKKRPIAWQLQSGKFTARTSPAFACLLYYHKLDVDALPKLRSQYVGPLRQRLETELRGIMAIAAEARSDRQVKRRAELDDSILELQKFDAILEAVAITGFGHSSTSCHAPPVCHRRRDAGSQGSLAPTD